MTARQERRCASESLSVLDPGCAPGSIASVIRYLETCPLFGMFIDCVQAFDPETGTLHLSNRRGDPAQARETPCVVAGSIFDALPADSRYVLTSGVASLLHSPGRHLDLQFDVLDRQGRRHGCDHRLILLECDDGPLAIVMSRSNATLRDALRQLEASESRFELALEGSRDGTFDWLVGTSHVQYSPRNREMLGYSASEFPDRLDSWETRLHPDDRERVTVLIRDHLARGRDYEAVYRILAADGSYRWWRSRGRAIRNEHGEPVRFAGLNSDITEMMQAQLDAKASAEKLRLRNAELVRAKRAIEHAATHDALTGLPNRRYLSTEAQRFVAEVAQADGALAAIQIDLDNFKHVNDALGHAAGDALLVSVAKALRDTISAHEFVARTGGDEFVILSKDAASSARLQELAHTILARLAQPFDHGGKQARVSASVGVAIGTGDTIDAEKLLINADIALYKAKERGRNCAVMFSRTIEEEHARQKELEEDVMRAFENGEFEPHFQLQFFSSSLRIAGVEALVRWEHPTRGTLGPQSFLETVNDLGFVAALDHMILDKANRFVNGLRCSGHAIPLLSVNVSLGRLSDPLLFETIDEIALEPGRVAFEMLESVFLDERDPQIDEAIRHLRQRGIAIELDDFGTGHTSIVSLLSLRPDRIKLDRQLISKIAEDIQKRTLVRSIIDMAGALGIGVLAEGVENRREIEILRELDCEVLQGFALARPMPAEALRLFLQERREAQPLPEMALR